MACGSGKRIVYITDTCSALKLAFFGEVLFKIDSFMSVRLVLHPRTFQELRKFPPNKKTKYKKEIDLLNRIGAEPDLRPNDPQMRNRHDYLIRNTADHLDQSIGAADIDILISVLHRKCSLVTNDAPLSTVAKAFQVDAYEAEEILVTAFKEKVISKNEAVKALEYWEKRQEKRPKRQTWKILKIHKLI